jgi:protein CMS1
MSQSPELEGQRVVKRKRQDGQFRREREKKRTRTNLHFEEIDEAKGINLALGNLNSDLLADYIAKKMKKFDSDATSVELEDKRLPGSMSFATF